MSEQYTPTTGEVLRMLGSHLYEYGAECDMNLPGNSPDEIVDRWLAKRDAIVAAKALQQIRQESKMATYEDLLARVYNDGTFKDDRTGTGTLSITGGQIRYDLAQGFPLITTKKVFLRGVIEELLWFIRGSTNAHELRDKNVHIWDAWAPEDGDLGPVYGHQWRNWVGADGHTHDQLLGAIETLRTDPTSRRIIVSAWNVADLDKMALPPCHMMFQFIVQGGRLDCVVTQRSADMLLGVPFDIASYALLTTMVAQQVGMKPGVLVWNGGDCHIYGNHVAQVQEQLTRFIRPLPTIDIVPRESILDYKTEDFSLVGYDPHPAIRAPVAI